MKSAKEWDEVNPCSAGKKSIEFIEAIQTDARSLFAERVRTEQQIDDLANELYTVYCKAVGGKAFNGDALPDWRTFRADPAKMKQSEAWMATARAAVTFSE